MNDFIRHPWHDINSDFDEKGFLNCFVEILPNDQVKYEIDKPSGILKVDRPQKYSNFCPAMYGFIPKTISGNNVATLANSHSITKVEKGDNDPLDVLIISSFNVNQRGIIVKAKPIGGLLMIDNKEADDKIIAIIKDDEIFGHIENLDELNKNLLSKIEHYFLTYKAMPAQKNQVIIEKKYNSNIAIKVIEASILDYKYYRNIEA